MAKTWEDIRGVLTGWTKTVNQKAEELSSQAALHLKRSAKRAELEEAYTALGKLAYEASHTEGEAAEENSVRMEQLIAQIGALKQQIEDLQSTDENE